LSSEKSLFFKIKQGHAQHYAPERFVLQSRQHHDDKKIPGLQGWNVRRLS
jgi:hypothetical protein